MNKLFISALCLLCFSKGFSSSFEKKIDHFFDTFNVVSNTSSSEFINSQLGVHFLGGSGTVRQPVYNVNPIHISLPTVSAGCGGIDYTLGGINIASKDEMKKALKSIATNGASYAFLLGMETISPVISSTMKQIQTWANQLNSININSCEIATSLVQGMWPKTQRASAFICEHAATSNSLFRDHIEAKHGCRDDQAKRKETVNKVQRRDQDTLVGNYNVAWKALEKVELDPETKNLLMNITGTIVAREFNNEGKEDKKIQVFPPKYERAIDLLRFGGKMEDAYAIENNQIDIKTQKISISPEKAWKNKIYSILKSLQIKIMEENRGEVVSLNEEEKKLLSSTYFPIGSLLSLMTQYNGKGGLIALDRYSDLIAFERVLKFVEEVIRATLSKAEALRVAQFDGYELDEYIKQVRGVLKAIQLLNADNLQKISAENQVIDYLIKIDRTLREKERGF